jgi:epoxyqueuosine reductase
MTQLPAAELKARLVFFARDVGFDSCRVAVCNPPAHGTEFREWLRQGAHGEMNYMQRGEEKRCNPQKILPGAQSIVALALK